MISPKQRILQGVKLGVNEAIENIEKLDADIYFMLALVSDFTRGIISKHTVKNEMLRLANPQSDREIKLEQELSQAKGEVAQLKEKLGVNGHFGQVAAMAIYNRLNAENAELKAKVEKLEKENAELFNQICGFANLVYEISHGDKDELRRIKNLFRADERFN